MYVRDYIDEQIPVLHTTDTVVQALHIFEINKSSYLPVVDENLYFVGIADEDTLMELEDTHLLSQCNFQNTFSVFPEEHLYNALKYWFTYSKGTTILSLVDKQHQYIGSISSTSVLEYLSHLNNISDMGGIIVLDIPDKGYNLPEIVRIVESNEAYILGLTTEPNRDKNGFLVTLRVSKSDVKDIILTFERYEYQVVAVFHHSEMEQEIKERYDSLMMYLNI
jgi:predicted transcriptional regulator